MGNLVGNVGGAKPFNLGTGKIGGVYSSDWKRDSALVKVREDMLTVKPVRLKEVKTHMSVSALRKCKEYAESHGENPNNFFVFLKYMLIPQFGDPNKAYKQKKSKALSSEEIHALGAWGSFAKNLSKNAGKDISGILSKIVNEFAKDNFGIAGAIFAEVNNNFISGTISGALGAGATNAMTGKGFLDFEGLWKEALKAGVKNIPKVAVSLGTIALTYIPAAIQQRREILAVGGSSIDAFAKLQTSPEKIFEKWITKGAVGAAKDGYKDLEYFQALDGQIKTLEQQLDSFKESGFYNSAYRGRDKRDFNRELKNLKRQRQSIIDKQEVFSKLGMGSASRWGAGASFLKNYGASMGIGIGVDTIVSVGGNVLKNWLIDGQSFGDAIQNCELGSEFLKASVKGVCSTAGAIIGGAFGNAELGKKIGSVVGGFLGDYAVKPFTLEDGTIEQGWCAIAGCAVIGGALVAGFATAMIVCGATPPVGWVVGAAMLVGAGIGYGIVCLVHWFTADW